VWQKAHSLTLEIYHSTNKFPSDEKFGLISQLRRAAYSVPSNIAEGHSRNSTKEFVHFLSIAHGSINELKYFLILSRDLNLIDINEFNNLNIKADEISKMLYTMKEKLKLKDKK
jgi:four helix bundle protein